MYGLVYSQSNLVGTISTRDDAVNALENNHSTKIRLLSGKGGMDRAKLTSSIMLHKILGDKKQYLAESNYSGNGLATPTVPLWMNFIVASSTGASLALGYSTTTVLTMSAEFFGLLNLRS